MILIKYGSADKNIDVTQIAHEKLIKQNIIHIPSGDINRAKNFGDPLPGKLKSIFIIKDSVITKYDHTKDIYIDIKDCKIYTDEIPEYIKGIYLNIIHEELRNIHENLQIVYGRFDQELPEQRIVVRYLTGHEKVLEIGSNIGRNSLVIGYILRQKHNENFVTMESNTAISTQLIHNRNLNKMTFFVENSALSKRKLIQKTWTTIESDVVLDGYKKVNSITFNELCDKYKIEFDTLILDCEGAFYYILIDFPDILDNINMIIMENDYHDISQKKYIDRVLIKNNFATVYVDKGGWGPCYHNFYEVWKKKTHE